MVPTTWHDLCNKSCRYILFKRINSGILARNVCGCYHKMLQINELLGGTFDMKKKILMLVMTALMAGAFTGCGASAGTGTEATSSAVEVTTAAEVTAETTVEEAVETTEAETETKEDVSSEEKTTAASTEKDSAEAADGVTIRIGSLKGPTTMGIVNLMKDAENNEAKGNYEFTMETQPDVIAGAFVKGDLDIALIPANLAGVLYTKTEGNVRVISINTLGVLYCVSADDSIHSVKDLAGKTVLSTGQGATPEYTLNYLLKMNGVSDCTVEFKSEASEIAAVLAESPEKIAILPQPFVTAAMAKNDQLKTAFSLSDEWDALDNGSRMVTGVTVVSKSFLKKNKEAVDLFLTEQAESAGKTAEDLAGSAALVAEYGIIEKAPIAEKAIPFCGITSITGEEMKQALSGYLDVLRDADPASVGGAIPGDEFYYMGTFVE